MQSDSVLLKKRRRNIRQAYGMKVVYRRAPMTTEKNIRGNDGSNDSLLFDRISHLGHPCHLFYVMNPDYMRAFDN